MPKIWAATVSSNGTTYTYEVFILNLCAYQCLATKQKKFTQLSLLKQSDPPNLDLFRLTILCSSTRTNFTKACQIYIIKGRHWQKHWQSNIRFADLNLGNDTQFSQGCPDMSTQLM